MHQEPADVYHEPVMAEEVIEMFEPIPEGTLIDATFGGGGHAHRLLERHRAVVAFDRDPAAAANLDPASVASGRLRLLARSFAELDEALDEEGVGEIVGALFDLGVSSHQLDRADRGFSYRRRGPLDMRMGPDATHTAGEIVNEWPATDLADVIRRYGEERFAHRIADAIVQARPIADTEQLADIVRDAIPAAARRHGGHPARRTFQALRIAVNDELSALRQGLDAALGRLVPRGRCVVISYHSLEDRIVKRTFAEGARGCVCPPDLPVCGCGRSAELRLLTRRALRPSEDEVARNPRARSARLRAVERMAA